MFHSRIGNSVWCRVQLARGHRGICRCRRDKRQTVFVHLFGPRGRRSGRRTMLVFWCSPLKDIRDKIRELVFGRWNSFRGLVRKDNFNIFRGLEWIWDERKYMNDKCRLICSNWQIYKSKLRKKSINSEIDKKRQTTTTTLCIAHPLPNYTKHNYRVASPCSHVFRAISSKRDQAPFFSLSTISRNHHQQQNYSATSSLTLLYVQQFASEPPKTAAASCFVIVLVIGLISI